MKNTNTIVEHIMSDKKVTEFSKLYAEYVQAYVHTKESLDNLVKFMKYNCDIMEFTKTGQQVQIVSIESPTIIVNAGYVFHKRLFKLKHWWNSSKNINNFHDFCNAIIKKSLLFVNK